MRAFLAVLLLAITFSFSAEALHPSCKYHRRDSCVKKAAQAKAIAKWKAQAEDESDRSTDPAEQQREARMQKMKEAAEQTRCKMLQTC